MKTSFLVLVALVGVAVAKPNGIRSRIIGGQEAPPHSIKYQAFFSFTDNNLENHFCGGVLISTKYILTAANCVVDKFVLKSITLGTDDPFTADDNAQIRHHKTVTYHPQYNSATHENDIALIELDREVTVNAYLEPVLLPSKSDGTFEGQTGKLSGWGMTDANDGGSWGAPLRYVEAPILSNTECDGYLNGQIKSGHVCLSGESYTGGCLGDTGGPLTVNGVLVGVLAFQADYCLAGFPSVATRITSYLDWIEANSDV